MATTQIKTWITKYALTNGIQEVNDAELFKHSPSSVSVPSLGIFATFHGEGREWHRTRESAVEHANKMRAKKICALQKQITKLGKMEFNP